MATRNYRVMVVDDSALMREIISDIVDSVDGFTVAGHARDGVEAIDKIRQCTPDIVTLDVQMPRMDGLETLDSILRIAPIPVIMVSSLTMRAAETTFEALGRGALDYVTKPSSEESLTNSVTQIDSGNRSGANKLQNFANDLISKMRVMAGSDVNRILRIRRTKDERKKRALETKSTSVAPKPLSSFGAYEDACIAIAVSTGGPPALTTLFHELHPPCPPILIVQHMPANFTGAFANRLNTLTDLNVMEAMSGDELRSNCVYVAPGGKHLGLCRTSSRVTISIRTGPPVSSHKPSADVMMKDVARIFHEQCLGVIMTGMGRDGADGCAAIRAAGGYVLGQDESSSDVYGMNKVAFINGHVDEQFALPNLPQLLLGRCRKMFRLESRPAT